MAIEDDDSHGFCYCPSPGMVTSLDSIASTAQTVVIGLGDDAADLEFRPVTIDNHPSKCFFF